MEADRDAILKALKGEFDYRQDDYKQWISANRGTVLCLRRSCSIPVPSFFLLKELPVQQLIKEGGQVLDLPLFPPVLQLMVVFLGQIDGHALMTVSKTFLLVSPPFFIHGYLLRFLFHR